MSVGVISQHLDGIWGVRGVARGKDRGPNLGNSSIFGIGKKGRSQQSRQDEEKVLLPVTL